jgi:hypothetical protein
MLDIAIIANNDYYISPSKYIPSEDVQRKELYPDRKFFTLMPALRDTKNITGNNCLITGKKYFINRREYDIAPGYAIEAIITTDFKIYPKLRKAKGKEINVIKNENGFGMLDEWPKITLFEKEIQPIVKKTDPKPSKENSFTEGILSFYIEDEDSFDFDGYEE